MKMSQTTMRLGHYCNLWAKPIRLDYFTNPLCTEIWKIWWKNESRFKNTSRVPLLIDLSRKISLKSTSVSTTRRLWSPSCYSMLSKTSIILISSQSRRLSSGSGRIMQSRNFRWSSSCCSLLLYVISLVCSQRLPPTGLQLKLFQILLELYSYSSS